MCGWECGVCGEGWCVGECAKGVCRVCGWECRVCVDGCGGVRVEGSVGCVGCMW